MSRRRTIRTRVRVLGGVLGVLFVVLLARAADLQLRKGVVLRTLADQQQQRTERSLPRRGEILDRNGEELAVSLTVDSVFADPKNVEDVPATAKAIAGVLRRPAAQIESLLRKKSRFVWIERQLDAPVAEALRKLDLAGIQFTRESKRYYPNGAIQGQLLGFVGVDSVGLEGIERAYDDYIRSRPQVVELQRDALGRGISIGEMGERLAAGGYRVQLTVDKSIAWEAQRSLDEAVKKYEAKSGVAVVQDVDTGAILAMVTSPPLDPNHFGSQMSRVRNRVVTDVYEAGSTVKPLLLAAALEEKLLSTDTIIFCENGRFRVADREIRDTKEHGWLTAAQVVKYSSNIGSLKIGKMLGKEAWYRYLTAFGFGSPTGIDLPGESGGLMRPVNRWGEVLLATSSYGMGIASTPLQQANAMTSIANGGRLLRPYVVERIVDDKGRTVFEAAPEVRGRPISASTAERVRRVLKSVVDADGTAPQANIPGYQVAGKTGTAQKIDAKTGLYSREKYLASFSGFVPADDPRVSILVSLDEPSGSIYGGVVAAPVFARIAARAMQQLQVPPEKPLLPEVHAAVPEPLPMAADATAPEGIRFAGLTMREALQVASRNGVQIVPHGTGIARSARCAGMKCEVVFRPL